MITLPDRFLMWKLSCHDPVGMFLLGIREFMNIKTVHIRETVALIRQRSGGRKMPQGYSSPSTAGISR
jgi:hypothetical protein